VLPERQITRPKRLELRPSSAVSEQLTEGRNMGPVYYVISILGCADGSAQCVPAATVPRHYESEAGCRAAQPQALVASSDLDFPSLVAQCRAVKARPTSTDKKAGKPLVVALKG
jgi:hypothetical protein